MAVNKWVAVITDTNQEDLYRSIADVPDGRLPVVAVLRESVLKGNGGSADVLYTLDSEEVDVEDGDSLDSRAKQAAKVALALNEYERATTTRI
jgi:hypothetical protein